MENKKYNTEKIKEIINEIRIHSLLCCTEKGNVVSSLAEEYLNWLGEYSKYCIPETQQEWQETIRNILYNVVVAKPKYKDDLKIKETLENNEYAIIDNLYNFMDAGEIMKKYAETHSWKIVEELVREQGHSGWTFSGLSNILIKYSLIGVDFIEKFDPDRIIRDENFREYYNKAKEYMATRETLNKRLIRAISNKYN